MALVIAWATIFAIAIWLFVRGARGAAPQNTGKRQSEKHAPRQASSQNKRRRVIAHLRIKYEDEDEKLTQRDVDVHGILFHLGAPRIEGFCHLRCARRTFRADRIHECIDLDSGEIVEDLAAFFERHPS